VVEEDAIAGEKVVGVAVVGRLVEGVDFGARVRTLRSKRRGLRLRSLEHVSVHLA
jgi:hypothetical protein